MKKEVMKPGLKQALHHLQQMPSPSPQLTAHPIFPVSSSTGDKHGRGKREKGRGRDMERDMVRERGTGTGKAEGIGERARVINTAPGGKVKVGTTPTVGMIRAGEGGGRLFTNFTDSAGAKGEKKRKNDRPRHSLDSPHCSFRQADSVAAFALVAAVGDRVGVQAG